MNTSTLSNEGRGPQEPNDTGGGARAAGSSMDLHSQDTRIEQITRLRGSLAVCPTDTVARCRLAALLEELGQHEEALFNWRMAVASDPNNLVAREGFARCRRSTGF
jgi:thioredoxin-like negative regulator of GroEL